MSDQGTLQGTLMGKQFQRAKAAVCRSGVAAWVLGPAMAVVIANPAPVRAQQVQARGIVSDVHQMRANAEASPVPDVATIERGENPPASVSFHPLHKKQAQGNGAEADVPVGRQGAPSAVTRIEAGASEDDADADDYTVEQDGVWAETRDVPELHKVQAGDTLWTLCKTYFGNPYQWPQIWAINPLITNPHWIFPGDVIRLRDGDGGDDEEDEAPEAGPVSVAAAAPGPKLVASRPGSNGALMLRETGFLEDKDLRAAGRITGSREEKIMLSTGDHAYVTFPVDKPLRTGERYSIFTVDTDKPVKDANGKKVLGYVVRVYGELVLDQITDKQTGRGVMLDMVEPAERGYFVSSHIKQFRSVTPKPSRVNLEAKVVAAFSPTDLLAFDNFVVLSRGASDGLEVGNRSFVIRRGDGYAPLMEGWENFDDRYPKEVVAELLVVDVHENAAVAWIARSSKEIRVGETTETRKGY